VPCRVVSASSASSSIASIDRSVRSAGRVRRRRAGRMERPDRRRASQPPARVTARSARETENMRSIGGVDQRRTLLRRAREAMGFGPADPYRRRRRSRVSRRQGRRLF
jgi:hypothetical protein